MEACVHKAPNGAACKMARLFVRSLVGWVFFFPLGISYSLECNLGLRHTFFFFFNLRQQDLSLKGNTTSNKQH